LCDEEDGFDEHRLRSESLTRVVLGLTWEPVSGFEPLTCRLQVC